MRISSVRWILALFLVAAAVVPSACGDDEDGTGPETDPDRGSIRVAVSAGGTAVSGVAVGLFEVGGAASVATRTTGADGTALFADLEPGSWEVEVVVPEGRALASGEVARKSVAASAGQPTDVGFELEPVAGEQVVVVTLTGGLTFDPGTVTITPGTTVRWVNAQAMAHTVTPEGHDEWVSASLTAAGETFEHTFTTVGEFEYYCQPHVGVGMRGTVRVQP